MDTRFYKDGTPIILAIGDHGLGPKFPEYEASGMIRLYENEETLQSSAYATPLWVVANASIDVTRKQLVASRQEQNSPDYCTFDDEPVVEFIYFGRSHRYYARHYPLVAAYWRDNLFTEARILARSLQGEQAIAYEFLEGDGSLGAWMAHGIRGVMDLFSKKKIPNPKEYDPLMDRVWKEVDKLKASTAEDYPVLHEVGLEFMRIRYEQAQLTRLVRQRLEDLIGAAEAGEKGAIEVENAAFSVLDLYGQVRYSNDPASLAAYRCGVLLVRSGARFIGEKVADSSTRAALRAAGVIVRGELPKIVSGLILGYMKKGFKNPKNPTLGERFAEETVGLAIWAIFYTVDFYVFEAKGATQAEKAKENDKFLESFSEELAGQIIGSLLKIGFGQKIDKLAEDSTERIWLERLAAALPALTGAVLKEYFAIKKRADDEQRPFYEVFCSEAGWALVRIFKAVGTALLEAPIQKAMQNKMAADKEFRNKNYWKGVILAIKLQFAEIDPKYMKTSSATPVTWTQKVPPIKPGPDENGNIGINKLKPVAAEPNPLVETKPPKPPKEKRKQVKLDKTEGKGKNKKAKEWAEALQKEKFKSNSAEVVKKFKGRSNFKPKIPYYMCANCEFVHPSKKMFQVVHPIWDVEYKGDKNKVTESELKKDINSPQPKMLYDQGDEAIVLCGGCDEERKARSGKSGGLVSKEKGYANTKKDEDRNPDHGNQNRREVRKHSADGVPYEVEGDRDDFLVIAGGDQVYRLKDAQGNVLYIGEGAVLNRLRAHQSDPDKSSWFAEIAEVEVVATGLTHRQRTALEEDLIQQELSSGNSLYNRDKTPFQTNYPGDDRSIELPGTTQQPFSFEVRHGVTRK